MYLAALRRASKALNASIITIPFSKSLYNHLA